jgi:hypothetical protein
VAEERRGDLWCNLLQLHHTSDYDLGQWVDFFCGGDEQGRNGDEFGGDADGEPGVRGTDDHHAARESDGDCGTDGDVRGGGEWNCTAELPVAEERRGDLWCDLLQLHHASDHNFRQRINVRSGGQQHGGDGDEFGGDADGEPGAGVTDDHHATGEPDGDCGTDGDVHGGGEWNSTAELPVEEEQREHRRSHGRELHHAGNHDFG